MRILVCPPDHFDVDYVINPWMEGQIGGVDVARARSQWQALFDDVSAVADLEQVTAHRGNPDMCFTANAGIVESNRVLAARFRMPERSAEEPLFAEWFDRADLDRVSPPRSDPFEGEGDALFQPGEPLLWAGYGVRTTLESHLALSALFGVDVVSLRLVDPRFYHLDTCFAPLPGGRLLYYAPAFDARSQAEIEKRIPAKHRIPVSEEDATHFACNTLRVADRLFMNAASRELRRALESWGFECRIHSVSEFLKAGGGVKCLSLLLDQDPYEPVDARGSSPIRRARVQLKGHLLDAGLLRRALDLVTEESGSFRVEDLDLAERKDQESRTLLRISAPTTQCMDEILRGLEKLGASQVELS